jgi:hypothetical protein
MVSCRIMRCVCLRLDKISHLSRRYSRYTKRLNDVSGSTTLLNYPQALFRCRSRNVSEHQNFISSGSHSPDQQFAAAASVTVSVKAFSAFASDSHRRDNYSRAACTPAHEGPLDIEVRPGWARQSHLVPSWRDFHEFRIQKSEKAGDRGSRSGTIRPISIQSRPREVSISFMLNSLKAQN